MELGLTTPRSRVTHLLGAPELRFCSGKQICIFSVSFGLQIQSTTSGECVQGTLHPLGSLGLPATTSPTSFHLSHTGLLPVSERNQFLSTVRDVTFLLLLFARLFPSHSALSSSSVPSERPLWLQSLSIISSWLIFFLMFIGI